MWVANKTKKCIYCNKERPLNQYWKHPTRYDGLDGRCKPCIKERTNILKEIKKNAPPAPNECEICGSAPGSIENYKKFALCCDHNPITNEFRGWLCQNCNKGLGILGDDFKSISKAFNYLKRHELKNQK